MYSNLVPASSGWPTKPLREQEKPWNEGRWAGHGCSCFHRVVLPFQMPPILWHLAAQHTSFSITSSLHHWHCGCRFVNELFHVRLLAIWQYYSLMNCFNLCICCFGFFFFFDKCDFELNHATFINSKCWLIRINKSPPSCQQKWARSCTRYSESPIIWKALDYFWKECFTCTLMSSVTYLRIYVCIWIWMSSCKPAMRGV